MESTVEYSIAKESIEVHHQVNNSYFVKDNSGRVRTTFPMKNPFSQKSTSAVVLTQTDVAKKNIKKKASLLSLNYFQDGKSTHNFRHRKMTMALQIHKPHLPCQELSSRCETEQLEMPSQDLNDLLLMKERQEYLEEKAVDFISQE